MLRRSRLEDRLERALTRSPVVALLGPRQCGKTTLARTLAAGRPSTWFDLESAADRARLQNPELVLGTLTGLVVVDEIQEIPELFATLRVLVDRPDASARFLVLGSASPHIVRGVSETLAGRVEFIDMAGFDLGEVGRSRVQDLWVRGGLPRSFLAPSESDSLAWREGFVRTFLERDIPQLGIGIPAAAMRRFWTMLAHWHGQVWNASELGRSMGLSDKTVRGYLDLLTGTFMVRQLQPWFANVAKRQVKAPKIYLRDTGLLHSLLSIDRAASLHAHPRVGASWEGFVIEQVLRSVEAADAYFWGTHGGAEVDLLLHASGRRYAVEVKFSETPAITRSMRIALDDLELEHLWVVCPVHERYALDERITVLPAQDIPVLRELIGG